VLSVESGINALTDLLGHPRANLFSARPEATRPPLGTAPPLPAKIGPASGDARSMDQSDKGEDVLVSKMDRLRDALRAYHRYELDADGHQYMTWKDVREAIAEYTGFEIGKTAKIGAERLRQFVEGIEDKDNPGRRHYPIPRKESVEAIIAFLSHEEIGLVEPDELDQDDPGLPAIRQFTGYLDQGCDLKRSIIPDFIAGGYLALLRDHDVYVLVEISFSQFPPEYNFRPVTETRKYYDVNLAELDHKEYETKLQQYLSCQTYRGWVVVSPEDRVMFFMKHDGNGRNHSYYCLNDIDLSFRQGSKHLYMIHSDFPYEVDEKLAEKQRSNKQIKQMLNNEIVTFSKALETQPRTMH